MNPDGNKELEDCYYYLYSSCKRGNACAFRHCAATKQNPVLCEDWAATGRCTPDCPYRHSYHHLKKRRSDDKCFWETQETGCTKEFCEFRHENPAKDAWKEEGAAKRGGQQASPNGGEYVPERRPSPRDAQRASDYPAPEPREGGYRSRGAEFSAREPRPAEADGLRKRAGFSRQSQNEEAQPQSGWYKGRRGGAENPQEDAGAWQPAPRGAPGRNGQREPPAASAEQDRSRLRREAGLEGNTAVDSVEQYSESRVNGTKRERTGRYGGEPGGQWDRAREYDGRAEKRRPQGMDAAGQYGYSPAGANDESYEHGIRGDALSKSQRVPSKQSQRKPAEDAETGQPASGKQRYESTSRRDGRARSTGPQAPAQAFDFNAQALDDEIAEVDDLINRLR
ncbi:hypothetical protein PAPHI01_0665 [Pancytospora philotis]|nr:hypothetical protein PAPHI01_0665 [Pancytospora philotis]